MMKKWPQYVIICAITGIVVFGIFRLGMIAGAATSEPGSAGDPLITKSYLDERLEGIDISSATGTTGDVNTGYKKVTIDTGTTIMGTVGTEFVLYSGSGTVSGNSGLVNLSEGQVFKDGGTIVKYNSFMAPGKAGIKAASTCIIYVRGEYSLN